MSGNWACGMAPIAMMPASVITIEMTKANRGRSMKTLEIIAYAPAGLVASPPPGRAARPDPLQAVDDHPVAAFRPSSTTMSVLAPR